MRTHMKASKPQDVKLLFAPQLPAAHSLEELEHLTSHAVPDLVKRRSQKENGCRNLYTDVIIQAPFLERIPY